MRTKGAVSNVAINFQTLKSVLGDNFNGAIVVSAAWVKNVLHPEQFEMIEVGNPSVAQMLGALGIKPVENAGQAPGKTPVFTQI